MKKVLFFMLLLVIGLGAMAQQRTQIPVPQWTSIISNSPEVIQTRLISSTENSIKVNVQVPGFYTATVTTPQGEAYVITVPKSVSTAHAGEPDVPMTAIPVMISDKARMNARVIDAQYVDYENIEVAPSKGDFPRSIDPATVPYTYGECYSQDAFFPASNVGLYDPYIIRDIRGQNIVIYPFAYNPVTKTLRVYYNMTVEMYKVDDHGTNVIESRRSNIVKLDPDFKSVYQRHFINYEAGMTRYTPLDEEGDLLIICYDSFISSMTDFVNWKKTRGVNTTIVGTSTAGSSYTAIKNYIQSQYNANNNLTHVLLVGDVAQIPGYSYSGGGSSYSGLGDNAYGQIVGSDNYNDVFIGRFSASSAARVATQCNRVITYERDLTTSANWLQVAEGIAKKEGGSGHNGEDDYQHMDVIRTDLLNYGYSTVYQRYENLSGYTATASQISSDINSGVGIINYCNHGAETMWGVASYSVSHVNALTNENKLPFIWSVACLVGKYDHSSDCFAEAWMNATNNNNPTGAIGTLMSYISQPWIPPMWAQDECVDILAGLSSSGGTKHTWGGLSINGLFGIFDNYGSDQSAVGTYQAWILYGDPSMLVRTKTPQAMNVSHNGNITLGSSTYSVNVSNGNGAVATITDANHNILGKATVSNGTATINLNSSNLTPGSELTLCVFGFNKVTHLSTIDVVGGTQYDITVTQPQHGTISAPAQAYANSTVTLTAIPETGYCLSSWTVKQGNTNIPVTNNQFTMPEGNVTVTATFVTGLTVTLASANNGTISADPTCALQGTTINLTATPATGYVFDSWVVYKTGDASTTVNVNGNSFTMPAYNVTVVGIFLPPAGGDVTIGSGTSSSNYLPTGDYYKYSLTQQIYTASELGTAGTITAISFYYNTSTSSNPRSLQVYMSHTSSSNITAWSTVTSSQRVFSGTVTFNQGWNTITLTTPFAYNGTSNVLLTVDDNTGSWTTNSQFYTYATGANRAIYYRDDSTNPDPTGSVSVTANSLTANAQMKVTKEVPSTEGYLSVSPASLTGFEATSGATASNPQSVAVIGANLQANLTVTAPTGYEVSTTSGGTYNSTLTLTPSNGSIRANVFVRLSSGVSAGNYNGNLTMASGTTSATVSLSGTVAQGTGTSYNITATANPTAGGTVTGAGTYYENGTCTLVATANTGYTFSNWTKNGSVVSSNATYTFTVNEANSGAYVANFTLNSYEVMATANPAAGGTITGAGSYNHGATATLIATANEGYTFTGWKKGNTTVSTNATYSFTVTEAATLVANFTLNSYTITAIAEPSEGGIVTIGSNRVNRDDLVYDFENGWQGWTSIKGTTGTSTHNWMHNTEYYAYDSNGDQIVPVCHNSSSGMMLSESYISASTSGGSDATAVYPDNYLISPQFRLGGSLTFYAASRLSNYPAEKFSVLVSTSGNTSVSDFTQTALTVTLSDNSWNEYTIDLSAYSGMGYVAIRHYDCYDQHLLYVDDVTIVEGASPSTGSGNFNYGETCVVTATPNTDYHFVNWTENGTTVSSEASYSFTVTGDRDLVANFSQTLPEPCSAPTNLTVTVTDYQSAVLTWGGVADSWKVAYKPSVDAQFTEVNVNTNTYSMTGLEPNTGYTVMVAAVCDDEIFWCDETSFTTLQMPCYAPTNLTASEVGSHSAMLNWTADGEISEWLLQYGTDNGFATGTYTEVNMSGEPATELVGLTAETQYYARVKTVCGADNESEWSNTSTFMPTCYMVIGSGTGTNSYLPSNVNNKYSLTQQIYTVAELGEAGNIVSIGFRKNSSEECERNLEIYMVSTDKSAFTEAKDWVAVTTSNKVFSGTVSFADNDWTTITLDRAFSYDGTSNIAIMVDDNTGRAVTSTPFLSFPAGSQALRVCGRTTNYKATSAGSYSGTIEATKNQIRIQKVDYAPLCDAPAGLAVSELDHQGAMLTWNGEADSWTVSYRPANTEVGTEVTVEEPSYTLTGLDAETSYKVKVAANCGDETVWSEEIGFTTQAAPCTAIVLGDDGAYRENFDNYTTTTTSETGVQPHCWEVYPLSDVSLTASTMPQVYRGFATSGSYSLRMKNRCVYAMPELDENIAIDQLTMTFNLRQPNSIYRLQVGVVNANGAFTLVKTINNAGTGIESVTVDFAEYTGDGHRIAFRNTLGKGSTLSYSYNYIDDIVITSTTATACGIDVLPYPEQFEGYTNTTATETGVQPDCWEVITEDVALSESTKPQLYRGYSTSGDYTLRLKNRCVYAMPEFTTDVSVSDLTMTFNLRQPNSNYRLQVGVLETDGSFTALKTLKSGTSMQSKTVNFSGYTGTGNRIAFRNTLIPGTGMSTDYLDYSINYIDDINLFLTTGKSMEVTDADAGMMGAGRDMLDVMVYPNPTKEFVNVQCTMYNVQCTGIEVVDVYGKVVRTDVGANNDSATQINVSGLAAGMYFVRVTTDKGVVTKPFVKK